MSNLTSNLKTFGSQGQEYPTGYSYIEGEQPVDAWDNFITFYTVAEIHELQSLANTRQESSAASSRPTSPEVAELFFDSDDGVEEVYDGANWRRFLFADGDSLSGNIDVNGYKLTSSSGKVTADADLDVTGDTTVDGANLATDWLSKQEGGTVTGGNLVPLGCFGLEPNETLVVRQALLSADGFTTPASAGVDLIIADDQAVDATDTTTILAGDGNTLYDGVEGAPLETYTNTSGSHRTVIIGIDNGNFNAGTGVDEPVYGGFIAMVQ